ncbi:peptidoglycan DD-metalloendopeptidase family protein [Streptomyces sp. NPDC051976]|uniref:M23 family metallopeptidase n=1 Tax=Streptomyces sp. NPDC051976 TaxID=3154947 RepID=UPI003420B2E9
MPAQGQHRKPRSLSRLTRICVIAGTGGVAIALPLVGADIASAQTPASAPAAVAAQAPHAAPKAAPKATQYKVVRGDTLSKIATSHHVAGGWHRVYNDNKTVIGSNPNIIRPGEKLTLNGPNTAQHAVVKKAVPAPAKKAVKPAAKPAAVKTTDSGYTKPVGNAAIGTPYHQAGSNWSSGYHTGVDFLVGTGTPIHAIAAGTVVSAGWDGAYGNDVIIKHPDGKYTLYAHQSQLLVSAGQTVTEGQQIGLSGATGNVTGPHLHFEVRTTPYYGSDIDPVAYLAAHGVTV